MAALILPKTEALSALNRLDAAARPLIAIHKYPDGDALGAGLGLAHILWGRGRDVELFCGTSPGPQFSYLGGIERIKTASEDFLARRPEVIVVLDSGDLVFCGIADLVAGLDKKPYIINIDHHATNALFGQVNIVAAEASSTVEVLYGCVRLAGWRIPRAAANCFLTGLMTDTGVFSNLATTTGALAIAADLLAVGAKPQTVFKHNYRNKSLGALQLWGEAFQRLRRYGELGLVVTAITQEDLKKHNASEEDADGLANFLNSLSDAEALLVLVEHADGTVKGSLRTTKKDMDVSRIARLFGGGGHVKAAGFTIQGCLVRSGDSWRIVSSPYGRV